MNKFLSEIKGFTPVIDILAQELGLMTAVVYGIVWRYCQMKDRVCKASLDKIAQHAGISRKTVKRHIVKLCDAGYLIDLTPEEDHAPHLYADTGRAKIIGLLSAEVDTSESEVGQRVLPPRSESPTPPVRESYKESSYNSLRKPPAKDYLQHLAEHANQKQQGGETEWSVPGNGLVAEAIDYLYELMGSDPPKEGSGTWHRVYNKIEPVLRERGIKDIARVRAALASFREESPVTFKPFYGSFADQLHEHLGRTDGGRKVIKEKANKKIIKVGR